MKNDTCVILIVEDESAIRLAYQMHFSTEVGIELISVETAEEALDQIRNRGSEIDICVVDGDLGPGKTGVEFIQQIRREMGYAGYVIANSSNASMTERMMRRGADVAATQKAPFKYIQDRLEVLRTKP